MNLTDFLQPLPDSARVWVYPSTRVLSQDDITQAQIKLDAFTSTWAAHGQGLAAKASILSDRFVVIAVDEAHAGASGCSIDSSVAVMRELAADLNTDFFERMQFYSLKNKQIEAHTREQLTSLDSDSLMANPLVKTLGQLRTQFFVPLQKSWHARLV